MDVGGAFPLLETVILRFRGLVDHVGREVVDDCLRVWGSDLSLAVFMRSSEVDLQ